MDEPIQLTHLQSALRQLKEAVASVKDDLDRDGAIQRFEFTFELLWKVLQKFAQYQGVETASPRDAFRVAADLGVIDDPKVWFDFLKDRNLTTHVYSEKDAASIFAHLPSFIAEVEKCIEKLKIRLGGQV